MNIHSIHIRVITAPLKKPFETALETITKREAIIVEVRDKDGLSGWGEVVAFSSPWYTEETIQTCYMVLKEYLIPALCKITMKHPSDVQPFFSRIRGNHMAKSGLEAAVWDLYSKQINIPLHKLFGGTREEIETGVVIASHSLELALSQIESYKQDGYKRYKVKIHPQTAVEFVGHIRECYPNLPLMVDANSAFSLEEVDILKKLDSFQLMMIEQPLEHDDLLNHRQLQMQLSTPICLDESITSYQMAKNAVVLESCQIVTLKMGRVGGWTQALNIHQYCLERNIPIWCGGMIEFGISRAHNIALASLEGFTLPGDISSSDRYWEEDIIEPLIKVKEGKIPLSSKPGIGYEVSYVALRNLTIHEEIFRI